MPEPDQDSETPSEHDQYVEVERTLDQKVSALLKVTAASAATVATNRVRKRVYIVVGVLLAVVLGGLVSIQVQILSQRDEDNQQRVVRCQERNKQAASVGEFAARMADIESTNQFIDDNVRTRRIKAYDDLAAAYGSTLDCTVFLK